MHKIWLLIGLVSLLTACEQQPPRTNGGIFLTEEGGAELHWEPASFPIQVVIDARFTAEVQLLFLAGCEAWNVEFNHTFRDEGEVFVCTVGPVDLSNVPAASVAVTVAHLPAGYVAVTLPDFTPQGAVQRAVVAFSPVNDASVLYGAMIHELGHVLCLAHDPDPFSIMFPTTDVVGTSIQRVDIAHVYRQMYLPYTFRGYE